MQPNAPLPRQMATSLTYPSGEQAPSPTSARAAVPAPSINAATVERSQEEEEEDAPTAPSAHGHRTQGQQPNPTSDQAKPLRVFLSHSKYQSGTNAQTLNMILGRHDAKPFLDSNDLENTKFLETYVVQSSHFLLMMFEYDAPPNKNVQFGPFGRKACVIELVAWFVNKKKIKAAVINIKQDGMITSRIPTDDEMEAMFDEGEWAKVIKDTKRTDAKDLAVQACQALREFQPLEWTPTDLNASLGQIANILTFLGINAPPPPALELNDAHEVWIVCAKDSIDEAALIAHETKHAFQGFVSVSIDKDIDGYLANNDNTSNNVSVVFLLTTGILEDRTALTTIKSTQNCARLTAKVSRPDVDQFSYSTKPVVDDAELKNDFRELTRIGGQVLNAHSNTTIVNAELSVIWKKLKLVLPADKFPPLAPLMDNVEAKTKARKFVKDTGVWFFDEIGKVIESKNAIVLVGVAELGKSVLLGELCARHSWKVKASLNQKKEDDNLFPTVALHFFKHDDANLNSARVMIGSIARQLAGKVNGYSAALNTFLEACSENQLKNLATLFKASILDPATAAGNDGGRVLVVLDALDECAEWTVLLPLLDELWPQMPKRFVLVASTRPESSGLNNLHRFEPANTVNKDDIMAFVTLELEPTLIKHGLKADDCQKVCDKAKHSFLYAVFACSELKECTTSKQLNEKLRELPDGMVDYYVRFFDAFKKSLWGENSSFYMAALAPILAARVPLPVVAWKQTFLLVFGTEQKCSRFGALVAKDKLDDKMKEALQRLLDFSGGTVKVLHKSMADFLRGSEAEAAGLRVDVFIGHELIAQRAISFEFKGPSWESLHGETELYFAGHVLFHMMEVFDLLSEATADPTLGFMREQMCAEIERVLDTMVKQILDLDSLMRSIWAAQQDSNFYRLVQDVGRVLNVAETKQHSKHTIVKFTSSLLHLSKRSVMRDPREFAGQILGRVMIPPFDPKQSFWIKQAQKWIKRASEEGRLQIAVPMCFGRSGLTPAGASLSHVLEKHAKEVTSVAISPDSKFIVTGSRDKTARVWDFQTGKVMQVLTEHTDRVSSVAISPDSKFIVTGSWDNTARVWNSQNGEKVWSLNEHAGAVRSVAFSPNFKLIVTGSDDGTARVWDYESRTEVHKLEGHTDRVCSVAMSPDSKFIVTGSYDNTARVWDSQTGQEMRVLARHRQVVTSVAISPDSKFIVTGSQDKTVGVWDSQTGQRRLLEAHVEDVSSVTISPDSQFIVTGSNDKTARVWDSLNNQQMLALKGHTKEVSSVAISPDSKFIVTGSRDNTARVWNYDFGTKVRELEGHPKVVRSVAMSPDSKFIVTGSEDNTARVWDSQTGKKMHELKEHTGYVTSVAISPDSECIVTGSYDNTVRVWNSQTGQEMHELKGHTHYVISVAISPDSKFVATGSWDKTARVWDFQTGLEMHKLKGHTGYVTSVAISPDSKFIVTGSEDKTARVWDFQTGLEMHTLKEHTGYVTFVAISLDSEFIVTESVGGTAQLWEVKTGLRSEKKPSELQFSKRLAQESMQLDDPNSVGFTLDASCSLESVGFATVGKHPFAFLCWSSSTLLGCLEELED